MPVDPSIPLSANPPPDIIGQMRGVMSLRDMALRMRQDEAASQAQNALRQVFANPSNLDQKTGFPTPAAMGQIMAIDPNTGMQLRQNQLKSEQMNLALAGQKSELQQQLADTSERMVRSPALVAYEEAKSKGLSEPEAQAAGQRVYSDGLQELRASGLASPDQLAMVPSDFNYQRVKSRSLDYKSYIAQRDKEQGKTPEEQAFAQFKKEHPGASAEEEKSFIGSMKQGEKAPPSNPQAVAMQRFLEEHPDASSDEIASFAQKSRAAPRSGQAMAVQKFIQEHPDASADDIAKFTATLGKEIGAAKAFGTGKQGDTVRSMNVAVQHLDTLGELADALQNSDVKALNHISQTFKDQFGGTAPSNFNAAKIVVGNEIIKAVIGAAGALGDRETAQANLDAAKTPAQLHGVIDTYQKLMAGQLNGLRRQYEQSTGQKDFDTLLDDHTKSVMRKHGYEGGGSAKPTDDEIRTKATTAWGSYDPDKYEYRVNPDTGTLQRRTK